MTNNIISVIIGNTSVNMTKNNNRNTKAKQIVWNFLLDNAGEKF